MSAAHGRITRGRSVIEGICQGKGRCRRQAPAADRAHAAGGRLVENEFFKGEWSTELDFAILAAEWRAAHSH